MRNSNMSSRRAKQKAELKEKKKGNMVLSVAMRLVNTAIFVWLIITFASKYPLAYQDILAALDGKDGTLGNVFLAVLQTGYFMICWYAMPQKHYTLLSFWGWRIPISWSEGPKWFFIPLLKKVKHSVSPRQEREYTFSKKRQTAINVSDGTIDADGVFQLVINPDAMRGLYGGVNLRDYDETERDMEDMSIQRMKQHLDERLVSKTVQSINDPENLKNHDREASSYIDDYIRETYPAAMVKTASLQLNPDQAILDALNQKTVWEIKAPIHTSMATKKTEMAAQFSGFTDRSAAIGMAAAQVDGGIEGSKGVDYNVHQFLGIPPEIGEALGALVGRKPTISKTSVAPGKKRRRSRKNRPHAKKQRRSES